MSFDPSAIRAHVELRHMLAEDAKVDGVLTLTTIEPNLNGGKDAIHTLQIEIGDIETEIKTILSYEDRASINLYTPWCIFRRDLPRGKKGGESEVVRVLAFVADMDNDTGKAGVMPIEAPYMIETSPGNSQHVLLLARALPPDEAKPIAMALSNAVRCDARSKDVSGIWRIPGTHNWPNKKKLARGRPRDPQAVKVATPWAGELVEPEKLWEAVAAHSKPNGGAKQNGEANGHNQRQQSDRDAIIARIRASIGGFEVLAWIDTECLLADNGDRSVHACRVVMRLFALSLSDDEITVVAHGAAFATRYDINGGDKEWADEIRRLRKKSENEFIQRLNRNHAVVQMGSRVVILSEQGDVPQFLSPEDFHLWYANDKVNFEGKNVAASRAWIAHPERRQYSKVTFDPRDTDPSHYNLWRDFSVKPDASKSCEKILAHIRDVICGRNEEYFRWVIGWLAHIVQRPWEKPGVSLVLRGPEGAGKGFFANCIGRLCPSHYLVISQSSQLTGRFNAHLQRALLVFVDEAFWAGDKSGEGALKHLVTDPELLIEGKHKDAFMVRNISRLIIASNEQWVVPAGTQARRWLVLDVADTHANDRKYFAAIDEELRNGGLEGLMHVLTTFDLRSVDVHTAPKTAALLEQKEESFAPHVQWWNETLERGTLRYAGAETVRGFDQNEITETSGWPTEIQKDQLWQSYRLWMQEHNVKSRVMAAGPCIGGLLERGCCGG
jgi:Family of unknown function (DUF5906)